MSHVSSSLSAAGFRSWEAESPWTWQLLLALAVLVAVSFLSGESSIATVCVWSTIYMAMVFADRQLATFALVSAAFLFEATRPENGSISVTEIVLVAVALRVLWSEGPVNLLKRGLRPNLQDGFLFGFFSLALLSMLWVAAGHGEVAAALKSVARYAEYAVAYVCFCRLVVEPQELKDLEFFLVLVATVFAIVGIYQHLVGPFASAKSFPWGADVTVNADPNSFRIYSVFPNPIYFSAFCAFFVPFTLDRVLNRHFTHRLSYVVCCSLISVTLLLTSSRTGMLGAAIGLFVLAGKNLKKIVVFALVATVVVSLFSTDWLENRLLQTGSDADLTAAIRVLKYYRTALVIAAHPIAGVGTGEYQTYFLSEVAPDLPKEAYGEVTAENTFLQIGAELGLPGMIVLCALVITILIRSYRMVKWKIPGSRGLLGGIVAFEVSNLFASMTAVSMVLFTLLLYVIVKRSYEFSVPVPIGEASA